MQLWEALCPDCANQAGRELRLPYLPPRVPTHLPCPLGEPPQVDPAQGPLPPASQPAPSPHLTSLSRQHADEQTSPHPDKRTTPPGFPLSLPAPPIPNQTSRALQGTVVWGKGPLLEGKGGRGFQEPPPLLPPTGKLSGWAEHSCLQDSLTSETLRRTFYALPQLRTDGLATPWS